MGVRGGASAAGAVAGGVRVLVVGGAPAAAAVAEMLRSGGALVDHLAEAPSDPSAYDLVVAPSADGPSRAAVFVPPPATAQTAGEAIRIDAAARMIWAFGHRLELTGREYALMCFFLNRPGQVFTRDELLEQVWRSPSLSDGAVTEYIRRLRLQLGVVGVAGCLRTRHGFGYYFDANFPAKAASTS